MNVGWVWRHEAALRRKSFVQTATSLNGSFFQQHPFRELGLTGHADEEIWNYAKTNGFTIVSKDKDFYQRALFYGSPPKFVWLCLGNCTRDDLLSLIQRHERNILAFETSPESVLVLS